MKVLQVGTLNRPIGCGLGYSPIETVISNIDHGLEKIGIQSVVACSGDSKIVGEHFVTIEKSFGEYWSEDSKIQRESMKRHLILSLKRATAGDIDIIHMHDAGMLEFIFQGVVKSPVPIVMTLHVPAGEEQSFKRWNKFLTPSSGIFFVPISEYQRKQHEGLSNLRDVIHHGLDLEEYPFSDKVLKEDYLFSIGRITPDKGQDKAIEVALSTKSRLIIAGNIQNKEIDKKYFKKISSSINYNVNVEFPESESDYYENVMKPILNTEHQIIYIGELNHIQKKYWFSHAKATLFPIQWGEPFGLVLIESMALGTPVIALKKGSVPEIIHHGKTGYAVDTQMEMQDAILEVSQIPPKDCRDHVEKNFSIELMAKKYSKLYEQIKR